MKKYLLLLCAAMLAGCATSYTKASDSIFSDHTGYSESPIDATTYKVNFLGNASTSADVVERYALYRAAELTVEKGYDYFIVLDRDNASDVQMHTGVPETSTSAPQFGVDPTTGKTATVTTSTTTQSVYTSTTHSSSKTIRMFKGERPADNASAYDARSMLKVMKSQISR